MSNRGQTGGNAREMAEDGARSAARGAQRAARSRPARMLARAGFVFVGVVHALIAWLAAQIAIGAGSGHADQSGAIGQLAGAPGGPFLLWAAAVCCGALAVWMALDAVARWRRYGKPTKALGPAGTAVAYLALTWLLISFAIGNQENSGQQSQETTAKLLTAPFGFALLIVVGLAVLGVGVYFGYTGITRSFLGKDAQPGETAPAWVRAVGTVGYTAKGVAVAVLGILILVATIRHDPSQQSGLDGALKGLAAQPFGDWILGAVAVGLFCYGVYSAARAKYGDFAR
ncbi:DUF1206 domain-containing protein [Sinomonas sp. ASV486]|uniref:DUF1206 domain-containing protein n=1 Tax=Sinomonas sp. ASV486 TaxID=3051170 RepID=UPI0027DBA3D0|nr:DUF1206 domain-containing protein [Sinomonas sp. ASV486]MDQ4490049.1 DUF1206 domain-containing protein [Sinomonas sp. ASV486]